MDWRKKKMRVKKKIKKKTKNIERKIMKKIMKKIKRKQSLHRFKTLIKLKLRNKIYQN